MSSMKMVTLALALFLLTACGGRGGTGERVERSAANAPGAAAQAQLPSAHPAANLTERQLVGSAAPVSAPVTLGGREGQRPAGALSQGARGERGGAAPSLPALPSGGSTGSYEAQAMINAFAADYLGLSLTSARAGETDASVSIPAPAESEMVATISLAGQVAAGIVTTEGGIGAAQVAVGEGAITGDLTADIDSASAGAFSLLLQGANAPVNEQEALSLILMTYPGLANAGLLLESTDNGYLFKSVATEQQVSAQEREVTASAQVVVAGVIHQGVKPLVWAVVANGSFAAALEALR